MKKIIALLCSLVLFVCTGVACALTNSGESDSSTGSAGIETSSKDNETEEYYTVTFDSDGGTLVAEQRVCKGAKIVKPKNPQKASTETIDFEFIGWYVDGVEWNFDKNTVEKDVILRAKWEEKMYSVDLPI